MITDEALGIWEDAIREKDAENAPPENANQNEQG